MKKQFWSSWRETEFCYLSPQLDASETVASWSIMPLLSSFDCPSKSLSSETVAPSDASNVSEFLRALDRYINHKDVAKSKRGIAMAATKTTGCADSLKEHPSLFASFPFMTVGEDGEIQFASSSSSSLLVWRLRRQNLGPPRIVLL